MAESPRDRAVSRAARLGAAATALVVAVKLVAAALSGSISVLAEGLQSLLDVAVSLLTVWTVGLAARPADEDHPYGHGKAELLGSALQMVLVVITSGVIAWQAALRLHAPREIDAGIGVFAMASSLIVNAVLILYLRRVARENDSAALAGEAQHLTGDALATGGVLVGLLAYLGTGWDRLDPIIAILFTLAGAGFAIRHLVRVIHPLMDGALPAEEIARIEQALHDHEHVRGFHNVRTRQAGTLRIVSLHVLLDDDLTFVAAHDLAEEIESHLSQTLGGALVTVHYEPHQAELDHRAKAHG